MAGLKCQDGTRAIGGALAVLLADIAVALNTESVPARPNVFQYEVTTGVSARGIGWLATLNLAQRDHRSPQRFASSSTNHQSFDSGLLDGSYRGLLSRQR